MTGVVSFPPFNPPATANLTGAQNNLYIQVQAPNSTVGSTAGQIVSIGQLQKALALASQNAVVYQALSADYNNMAWVQYSAGLTCAVNDVLYSAIQSILSYSAAQMQALFLSATQQTL